MQSDGTRRFRLPAAPTAAPLVCERKYVAPAAMKRWALELLALHAHPDPDYPEGVVESIYFDDAAFSCYWEKANGDALKSKLRLRWYPGREPPPGGRIRAFLEIKERIGAARDKQHLGFETDWALLAGAPLHAPALAALAYRQAEAAGLRLSAGLVPTLAIRYHRRRFVCPVTQARLNLDSEIVSERSNGDLLAPGPRLASPRVVVEAKSASHRAWSWTEALERIGFSLSSFSKYGEFMETRIHGGQ